MSGRGTEPSDPTSGFNTRDRRCQDLFMEGSQKPLFDLLGAPAEKKKHIVYEAPHSLEYQHARELHRDVLSWLDQWLGQVEGKEGGDEKRGRSP